MKKLVVLFAVLIAVGSVAWIGSASRRSKPGLASPAAVKAARAALATPEAVKLIEADNAFALRLFEAVWKKQPNTDVCVCPLGVSQVVRLSEMGSGGKTKAEYSRLMGGGAAKNADVAAYISNLQTVAAAPDPYVKASIANCLWASPAVKLKAGFENLLKGGTAEVRKVKLGTPAANSAISQWFRDHTEGKIDGAGDPASVGTGIVLTNAVYFKGTWQAKFDRAKTKDGEFTSFDGRKSAVPMMRIDNKFACHEENWCEAIRMPYGNGDVAFYAFLPSEKETVDSLIRNLQGKKWSEFLGGFGEPSTVEVLLPRFKTDWSAGLDDALKALGLKSAFNPAKADFSRMSAFKPLWVQSVAQSTIISVDEEGTEAASGTEQHLSCAGSIPLKFDRPFLYAIVDDSTGVILFLGVYGHASDGGGK
jgi:serine protease inhibitor